MDYQVRQARTEDADAIGRFTADTFEWGDYIADVLPSWMKSENGCVMVATDDDDTPIALGRAEMMSGNEAWLQGTRVSEQWRRRGIASAIGESLVEWAIARGARVARLAIEAWNAPAQRQVEGSGFRRSSDWTVGELSIANSEPVTATNGGQRARARRKLEVAHSSEATPAWVSWRSGPLVAPARGLTVRGWRWVRLTADHLLDAGKEGLLWTSQAGWVITRYDDEVFYVEWLDCGPDDIDDLLRSIVDLAYAQHAGLIRVTVPAVDWVSEAFERAGFEIRPMFVYERAL